ncbi:uncharacterized protein LOC107786477 isoform X4 [Nicotiana tabacum]|uniref:Uncharacterized protein LOC107786477 isoform X4 n=1 Tax=Nicotiana tabacum TaxID=4097 RepID=A0AC58S089_TOBAC
MTIYVHVSNNTEPTADVVSSSHPGKKIKGRGKTTWFSVQKKQKDIDNEKLKVIIPPDRTVAVGPGAKDFVTELSVKVLLHARHDVKKWKDVPNLAKDRIVAHMLIWSIWRPSTEARALRGRDLTGLRFRCSWTR